MSPSKKKFDFYEETSVRGHSGVSILVNSVSLIVLIAVHLFFLKKIGPPFEWAIWLFGPMLGILLTWSIVVWNQGGTYRAFLCDGTLTIESPDRSMFGESAEIPVSSIASLRIRSSNSEGAPERHSILLVDGSEFLLDPIWCNKPYLDAKKLFRAITMYDGNIAIKDET